MTLVSYLVDSFRIEAIILDTKKKQILGANDKWPVGRAYFRLNASSIVLHHFPVFEQKQRVTKFGLTQV